MKLLFHPGQAQAMAATERFVFVLAGSQGGKTSFGPWWLAREINRAATRGQFGDWIAATATYDLFKLKMEPELIQVFCNVLGVARYHAADRVLELNHDQGRIILRSANVPGALESATGLGAWIDECGQQRFRLDSWDALMRRFGTTEGRVLGTTTPYDLGWLKTEIYDRWVLGDKEIKVVNFPSIMNPAYSKRVFARQKATMPDWKFRMFYMGQFERPEGLIYRDYNESMHMVEPFTIPDDWPRWVGIDFGPVHTAAVWLTRDSATNTYYLFNETLRGGLSTREHVHRNLEDKGAARVNGWFGGAKSEQQYRMDWQEAGIYVQEPPISEVEAGIDRVISLFRENKLKVFSTMRYTRDQLASYAREVNSRGETVEKIKDKAQFHMLDALRYGVSGMLQFAGSIVVGEW